MAALLAVQRQLIAVDLHTDMSFDLSLMLIKSLILQAP